MRVSRIYYPTDIEPRQIFEVDGKAHHYLNRVLRLKVGHEVRFFNGKGQEFLCAMMKSDVHRSTFICRSEVDTLPEPKPRIKLYLAVCKNEGMDFSVQKATELGIRILQPLITEHSLTHKIAAKRRLHWQGVAQSACEQCGRAVIPEVAEPVALQEMVAVPEDDGAIICCIDAKTPIKTYINEFLTKPSDNVATLHLMIGPEGGFAADEVEHAIAIGFEPVCLGDYVLRSETAVVAALSIVRLGGYLT